MSVKVKSRPVADVVVAQIKTGILRRTIKNAEQAADIFYGLPAKARMKVLFSFADVRKIKKPALDKLADMARARREDQWEIKGCGYGHIKNQETLTQLIEIFGPDGEETRKVLSFSTHLQTV